MSTRPATTPGWPWSAPFPIQTPQPHRRLVATELVNGTTVELGDALLHSDLTLMLQGQLGGALAASGQQQRHRPTSTRHERQPITLPVLARLHRIGQHPFRAKFRLRGRDRAVVDLRGITTVRRHAEELVGRRLAPAQPRNDGRQTPYRGHPVFVAQHATATCCLTCLARWHDIPAGHALDDAERGYVVEAIDLWPQEEGQTPATTHH